MICIYKEMEKFLAMFSFKYFDTIQISCKIFFAPLQSKKILNPETFKRTIPCNKRKKKIGLILKWIFQIIK